LVPSDPERAEKEMARKRAWEAANREKRREAKRASYDPEKAKQRYQATRDAALAQAKRYYEANREKIIARQTKWNEQNREKRNEGSSRWSKRHPAARNAVTRNRYARLKQAEGSHTGAEIEALYARQKGRCAGCGISLRKAFHADHIHPIALGGRNDIQNIQLLCAPCNQTKGAKLPEAWAQSMGRLL
jgi:5-methylcytosine-specific restriction endonuclease McrA